MKCPALSRRLIALASIAAIGAICIGDRAANAQTPPVYRCGSSYSQSPCADGRAVDVDDSRNAEQRAEAARVSAEAKQSATRMERDRLAEEARLIPAGAARLSAAPAAPAGPVVRHVKKPKRTVKPRRARATASATVGPTVDTRP